MIIPDRWTAVAASGIVFGLLITVGCAEKGQTSDTAQFELTEILRIGDEAQEDTIFFSWITGLDVHADGRIIVADRETAVYAFSDAGHLIRVIGGNGKGPGEFESIDGVSVGPGDSLFVLDSDLGRLSAFEPETHQLAYTVPVAGNSRSEPWELLGVTDAGFLIEYSSAFWAPGSGEGLGLDEERRAIVNLVNKRGAIVKDSVISLPDHEKIVNASGGGISVASMPFGRTYSYDVGADGLLYSGWSDAIDIAMSTANGSTQGTIRRNHEAVPVTQEDIDVYLADVSDFGKQMIASADLPKTMPAYETFTVDDQGRVWVKGYSTKDAPTTTWSVLSKEGAVVAEAVLPAIVTLKVIKSDRAYGRDSDLECIIVYDIGEF